MIVLLTSCVDDDKLRARIKGFTLKNRTWIQSPLTNTGCVVPGWIFYGVRNENQFYYTQLAPENKYLAGYYNGLQVCTDVKDAIRSIQEYPNYIVIFCTGSFYSGPTNTSSLISIPGTGEFINIFSGVQIRDGNIGVNDYGSIQNVSIGKQRMRCSDNSIRDCDGIRFGPDLSEKEGFGFIGKFLKAWQTATASAYKDGKYFIWGKK